MNHKTHTHENNTKTTENNDFLVKYIIKHPASYNTLYMYPFQTSSKALVFFNMRTKPKLSMQIFMLVLEFQRINPCAGVVLEGSFFEDTVSWV